LNRDGPNMTRSAESSSAATPRADARGPFANSPSVGIPPASAGVPFANSAQKAALKVDKAADTVLDWLREQCGPGPDDASGAPEAPERSGADGSEAAFPVEGQTVAIETVPASVAQASDAAGHGGSPLIPSLDGAVAARSPLRVPHTDWLHHRLMVTGPTEPMADFRVAACGAGTIPWQLDGNRMAEDFFHLLVAPPSPQRRRLSLTGARELARQLREAVERRHAVAAARVGHSRACPFDLHALVPVPADRLRLGPDHPDALAWLWAHWGTTAALRHVAVEPAPALRAPLPAGTAVVRLSFWSADWTPWRALAAVAARWPALRFDLRPTYGVL